MGVGSGRSVCVVPGARGPHVGQGSFRNTVGTERKTGRVRMVGSECGHEADTDLAVECASEVSLA